MPSKARKAVARKPPAARRKPSAAAQESQFERENDLRALRNADTVRRDPARMRGAQREAREQRRALDRVSKS